MDLMLSQDFGTPRAIDCKDGTRSRRRGALNPANSSSSPRCHL
jgi:hypothetical protein